MTCFGFVLTTPNIPFAGNDAKKVYAGAKKGHGQVDEVAEKVRALAEESVDPARREDLMDAMKHVDNTFRGEVRSIISLPFLSVI